MPNDDHLDFSFLNSDSKPESTPPASSPPQASAELSKPKADRKKRHLLSDSAQPAWMDQTDEAPSSQDSSTRFAAAFGTSAPASPPPQAAPEPPAKPVAEMSSGEKPTEELPVFHPEETVAPDMTSPASATPVAAPEPAKEATPEAPAPVNSPEVTPPAVTAAAQEPEEKETSQSTTAEETAPVSQTLEVASAEAEEAAAVAAEEAQSEDTETVFSEADVTASSEAATESQPPSSPEAETMVWREPNMPHVGMLSDEPGETLTPAPTFAEAPSFNSTASAPSVGEGTEFSDEETPLAATSATAGAAAATSIRPSSSKGAQSARSKKKKGEEAVPASGKTLVIIASYASAVTLLCLYLLMQSMFGKPHELESLPDIKPPMKDDEIAYSLAPESAALPPGHTLKIGQTQRFGNLKVTPLRIEKAPLQFTHYSGNDQQQREATPPVLKLWLKFENVSDKQTFAPLDRELILKRIVDERNSGQLRSNQFVCPASSKGKLDQTALLFDLEYFGDWNFAGISDDPKIGPGESLEIYLPSSPEKMDQIDGKPLVWRVQFRKGYHPKSYRGVTTLIEVKIDPKDIQSA